MEVGTANSSFGFPSRELILHLTQQCPLRCAHCFASSGPEQQDHLDEIRVLRAIDDAARLGTIERVGFSGGGDPFLCPQTLLSGVRHASAHGFQTTAVTSAFWATSLQSALRVLRPLAGAGLTRLSLSYDDPHAEFVPSANILNACRAGHLLHLEVYVAIVREPTSRITAAVMRALLEENGLGAAGICVYETGINSTGRALETSTEAQRAAWRGGELAYRGPCFSVFRQTSVTPQGRILPCCGTIGRAEELEIGRIDRNGVDEAVTRARLDLKLKWIALEGPVAILRQITADTDRPLHDSDFDGICSACEVLHSNPEYLKLMERALPAKLESLRVQEEVLTALGLLDACNGPLQGGTPSGPVPPGAPADGVE